jgi:CheY-like chemotaxis protein
VGDAARQRPASGQVLLVEDNPDVLEIAASMLRELGYRVLTACTGQEALARLGAGDPVDVILTDVVMPGISGIQLAEEVAIRWPATRILLTTGYAESLNALEGGRWQILAKPYRRDALAAKLREVLAA